MLGFLFLIGYLTGTVFFLESLFKTELVDSNLQGKS